MSVCVVIPRLRSGQRGRPAEFRRRRSVSSSMKPPEPQLTPEEIVARAEAMIPMLREQQDDAEQRGFYSQDVHERFLSSGFSRILQPRRFGGYEVRPADVPARHGEDLHRRSRNGLVLDARLLARGRGRQLLRRDGAGRGIWPGRGLPLSASRSPAGERDAGRGRLAYHRQGHVCVGDPHMRPGRCAPRW